VHKNYPKKYRWGDPTVKSPRVKSTKRGKNRARGHFSKKLGGPVKLSIALQALLKNPSISIGGTKVRRPQNCKLIDL